MFLLGICRPSWRFPDWLLTSRSFDASPHKVYSDKLRICPSNDWRFEDFFYLGKYFNWPSKRKLLLTEQTRTRLTVSFCHYFKIKVKCVKDFICSQILLQWRVCFKSVCFNTFESRLNVLLYKVKAGNQHGFTNHRWRISDRPVFVMMPGALEIQCFLPSFGNICRLILNFSIKSEGPLTWWIQVSKYRNRLRGKLSSLILHLKFTQ